MKIINNTNVFEESIKRAEYIFDNFEKIYVAFSGGKDSTVMFHLFAEEAIKRNRKIAVLFIDLEAQYTATINHCKKMFNYYKDHIELYWVCLPINLRNAVSNFNPFWKCWDQNKKHIWVRPLPIFENVIYKKDFFPFFKDGMEFEEFVILFGNWFSENKKTACCIGIRCEESLNRIKTIQSKNKIKFNNKNYTTKISDNVYNIYPIYDWLFSDLWHYHSLYREKPFNSIYELMYKANVKYKYMRLCQPFGDQQKQGLKLYHILEHNTWNKLLNRVNGVNSYEVINNVEVKKPDNYSWEKYFKILFDNLPENLKAHYSYKFKDYIEKWLKRGYNTIPDECPSILESKNIVPSYRLLCSVILKNDFNCIKIGYSPPKSNEYGEYLNNFKQKYTRKENNINNLF